MPGRLGVFLAGAVIAAPLAVTAASALETPKPVGSEVFLGPTVIGPNYKVEPLAQSDGMMRLFVVKSSYGEFRFDGVEFTKMRLRELDAANALDRMSQSDEFAKAFGNAAIAPLKFGANLITDPGKTIQNSLSGVANMFDRINAGMNNSGADRDSIVDSLLGVSDTQREHAVELGVDPYTDFPPLADRLKQVASAMASGGLPVKAGIALIPGGVGIAVSSVAGADNVSGTLRDKTAAQVIQESRDMLRSLGVPDASVDTLVNNRNYTPADLLIMSKALTRLHAQNTAVFIDRISSAKTRDFAFYERRHAELMAARSAELGGIVSFETILGHPVTVVRNGTIVAVFPFDGLYWTKIAQQTFDAGTAELRRLHPGAHPVFVTTGPVSKMATAEITKLGWRLERTKPLP